MKMRPNIKSIIKKIVNFSQPKSIYLFGSFADGSQKENSDLDFCIIKNDVKNKIDELADLRLELTEFPYAFDLIMLSEEEFNNRKNIWWTIQGQIQLKGKKLYEAR
jgi:predicted nucleotidyltransferase